MSNRFLNRTTFGDPKNAGNLMTLDEAHALLNEWVPNEKLRLHNEQVNVVACRQCLHGKKLRVTRDNIKSLRPYRTR